MSTFQLTPEQIESMTDEQIAEAYAQFKATNSLLQKRVAKAKRSGAIASTSKPNTLASVITANRANALAQNALGKAQTRANATAAALDSARSGFLAAQGREELTAEEQSRPASPWRRPRRPTRRSARPWPARTPRPSTRPASAATPRPPTSRPQPKRRTRPTRRRPSNPHPLRPTHRRARGPHLGLSPYPSPRY
jgi:Mg-chelatase subunit ChlI